MDATVDVITIGVTDLKRAREFYELGFGCLVKEERDGVVTLDLGAGSSVLELRQWDALADEVDASGDSSGFRGFTLSYIVEEAAMVDNVLNRVVAAGGKISKAPRNALWGYSAYITDPSGHLWKVASSKRRPLLGRKRPAEEAGSTAAKEITLTIGVADMKRAKQFYTQALGRSTKKDYAKFVAFAGPDDTSDLAMYTWEALAGDADVPPEGSGFRGLVMTHLVSSAAAVDEALAAAAQGGAKVLKPGGAAEGGHHGYFADPDGYLWKVAAQG
jgi:catechol 2,3-dioxygenase-like lactoylglutathione lyase family enzyme